MQELASVIDRIELPSQLSSVLSSRILQHVVFTRPKQREIARISSWLKHYFANVLSGQRVLRLRRFEHLIGLLFDFTCFFAEILPEVESFLLSTLRSWNGIEGREGIFGMLEFLKPRAFSILYGDVLQHLYRIFISSDSVVQGQHINFYSQLVKQWLVGSRTGETFFFSDDFPFSILIRSSSH